MIEEQRTETREEALERIRRAGTVAHTLEELLGPGPTPDDPEDLEEFLSVLESLRQQPGAR